MVEIKLHITCIIRLVSDASKTQAVLTFGLYVIECHGYVQEMCIYSQVNVCYHML